MIFFDRISSIHFVGICGTAMASLAAMLRERGYRVSGSDDGIYPPMSDFLEGRQIKIMQGYDLKNLRPEPDLVIIGNALSRGNPEIEYVLNFRLPYMSLPEALKEFFLRDRVPVVIAGTHGKTTTTAMIAWGLHVAGLRPDFLVGGLAENFESSYALGGGRFFVIEGDEYDSAFFDKGPKFMHYLPHLAVLGNVEFDHADIYPNLDSLRLQFARFVNLVPARGFLAVGAESPIALELSRRAFCARETFGVIPDCDWSARDIDARAGVTAFDLRYRGKLFRRIRLQLIGRYNIRNALAATAILHRLGAPEDDIREAMESFKGVRRRLQLLAEIAGIRIYEDFAHHPTAVRETLLAVREACGPQRLWAIYEPRSATSRRNVFQVEIAEALSHADCVAIPDLYRPEKVPEAERLDLARLIEDLQSRGREAWNLRDVAGIIQRVCDEAHAGDLIIIMSNGAFGGIYNRLPAALRARFEQASDRPVGPGCSG
ncbi:MAG: UDP-N-acetylmuramate:L-alanyl-gamma-D-glutamyl-meso-diaminopimelate ligase [Acidobacteria bacterium]|nr:UDP-N-acetylmuramate:L-alanyl-gamma-D-glutamyl-meso-diaminopimelate ligase [Acidobacteriota bacterium]